MPGAPVAPPAARRLYGVRRLLALVSIVIFVDTLLFGALIPLVPGYADRFDLSKLEAGLLFAAYGAGALAGGIPGGLLGSRIGPKRTVVVGLVVLGLASIGFALVATPLAMGCARFAQGFASAVTWAGALAWLTAAAPRGRRGQLLGTAFGFAVLGAIVGPSFGALAKLTDIRISFVTVGGVMLTLAVVAALAKDVHVAAAPPGRLLPRLTDRAFMAGLWLTTLPALFFGVLDVLAPLTFHDAGYGAVGIAAVFLAAGVLETGMNPLIGRISDSHGRLLPIRVALAGATVVAALLAVSSSTAVLAVLVVGAALSFGSFYTPGMALISDRAEATGLPQTLAFGVMNTTWALGAALGPSLGGALAQAAGDATPYLVCSVLCGATLLALRGRAAATVAPA
jgi:MFS family permease